MSSHNRKTERIGQIASSFGFTNQKEHLFCRHEKISNPYFRCLQSMAQNSLLLTSVVDHFSDQSTKLERLGNALLKRNSALIVEQSSEKSVELDQNDCRIFSEAFKHRAELHQNAKKALHRMYVTSTVSCFEVFIQDLLYKIFVLYPDTLRSNKTITYEEILKHPNTDSLVSYIAQIESSKGTEGSAKEYLGRLAKRFGIKGIEELIDIGVIRDGIEDLIGIRNIIVHSGGVVDAAYIRRYPQSGFQEGECVEISLQYIAEISEIIRLTIDIIETCVAQKFQLIATDKWSEEVEMYLDEILSLENHST